MMIMEASTKSNIRIAAVQFNFCFSFSVDVRYNTNLYFQHYNIFLPFMKNYPSRNCACRRSFTHLVSGGTILQTAAYVIIQFCNWGDWYSLAMCIWNETMRVWYIPAIWCMFLPTARFFLFYFRDVSVLKSVTYMFGNWAIPFGAINAHAYENFGVIKHDSATGNNMRDGKWSCSLFSVLSVQIRKFITRTTEVISKGHTSFTTKQARTTNNNNNN